MAEAIDSHSCSSDDDCGSGRVCLHGACTDTEADGDGDIDVDGGPCSGCPPGHICREEEGCIEDCRQEGANPCPVDLICSEISGMCVEPGEECTPDGAFISCGTSEFPPICGPGTECSGELCVAAAGCSGMVCDAAGVCRGTGCPIMSGSIRGVSLEPIEDAPRGAAGELHVRANVEGENLCGLTVTIEVRVETALSTSAGNDETIWRIDLVSGERMVDVAPIPHVFGIAIDAFGRLYALRSTDCQILRISGDPGGRLLEPFARGPDDCSRMAIGHDGALYVAGGLVVERVDLFSGEVTAYGRIPDGVAAWHNTFLTGIVFLDDGTLIAGEHWRGLFAIPPGGGLGALWAEAPARGLNSEDDPWNEGFATGPDGLVYAGVFPENPLAGFIYRVEADRSTTTLIDLATIGTAVPETNYSGIHGLAFGLDGSLYFTNQNTSGDTHEPFGQLLALRPDDELESLAYGFNFDWPLGYDGDLILLTEVVESVTAVVETDGSCEANLDVPDTEGAFEVRVLATDPVSGHVFTARSAAHTI